MTKKIEWRHFFAEELRAVTESDKEPKIEGYPAMFEKYSEDLGGFVEKIAPGAFANTLKNGADVRALWNHDQNYVLGRTKSGTLKLKEDRNGLYMENRPPDTQWAKDLMVSIGRKDVTQMSFGFWVIDEEWRQRKDKPPIRTLKEVELVDVSVVTFPAYPDTSVALRSMQTWKGVDVEEKKKDDIVVNLYIDGEEIGNAVAKRAGKNPQLITAINQTMEPEPNENEITIIDNEDSFKFRDFEQLERIKSQITELLDKSEAAQSRAEEKEEDVAGAQSRPVDVMERLGRRVRESYVK